VTGLSSANWRETGFKKFISRRRTEEGPGYEAVLVPMTGKNGYRYEIKAGKPYIPWNFFAAYGTDDSALKTWTVRLKADG